MRTGNQSDIWVMDANGTNASNITLVPGEDTDPHWGAGGRIVFTSDRSGSRQLYTVNPNGSGLTGPITASGDNFLAKWNGLGNRLVFISTRDGNQEVYTMRQGGEEQTRLTNNGVAEWDPAYAPDSSKIVFSSERVGAGNLELYIMGIDGTNQERITIREREDVQPSWKIQR
jgi:Tol biopolymer transport system component